MTLIGTTVPQLPVLSSAFVTDGITTALTKEVSNVCKSSVDVNRASCTCSSGNIRKNIKKAISSRRHEKRHDLPKRKSVEAKMNVGTQTEINLFNGKCTCIAVVSDVIRCYHCLKGGNFPATSSANEITAEISCGSQQQVAVCTRTGHVNTITFNFETPTVKENCTLRCPGGLTNFVISGNSRMPSLHFENKLLRK
ncbi:hypothetical protein COOONC_24271 [Cooperia oncophora]